MFIFLHASSFSFLQFSSCFNIVFGCLHFFPFFLLFFFVFLFVSSFSFSFSFSFFPDVFLCFLFFVFFLFSFLFFSIFSFLLFLHFSFFHLRFLNFSHLKIRFWGLGGQGFRSSPFEGDFAFMFFLFHSLGAENLIFFFDLNCFTSSYNISFQKKINFLSRLRVYPFEASFPFFLIFHVFHSFSHFLNFYFFSVSLEKCVSCFFFFFYVYAASSLRIRV